MSIRTHEGGTPRSYPRAKRSPRRAPARTTTVLAPAAARTATTFSGEELDLAGAAIETFTAAVGGRKQLLETLAVADSGSDKVVNCLLDPAFATWSLRRLCAYAGITVADLFASYKKALFVQAHVEAAHRITRALPPIVDDVMRRALGEPILCPRCHGTPTTPGTTDCPQCHGTGTVLSEPDLDRQKLALELGKLTERKAGVMVQQNAISTSQQLSVHGPGSLEQLQQAVGDLLFSPQRQRAAAPRVIDPAPAVVVVEVPGDREVRDDPAPYPRAPHEEEEPPLPFPDADPDEADEESDDARLQT